MIKEMKYITANMQQEQDVMDILDYEKEHNWEVKVLLCSYVTADVLATLIGLAPTTHKATIDVHYDEVGNKHLAIEFKH